LLTTGQKGVDMRRLFNLNSVKKQGVSSKFEQYISKELAYDLLRVHGSLLTFYSKKDGWIGANKAFFDLFKFENMDEFLEFHKSIRELFFTESEEIFVDDDTSWIEYIRKRKNGKYKVTIRFEKEVRYYHVYVTHSFSFKELFIVELEDITELELTTAKAKELENLKSAFLANISQEFRTPMNGVLGFVELLSQTRLDRLQKSYLTMLERSSETLMSNIEALLDLSQLQGGKLKPNNEYVDILKRLEKLASHYTYTAHEGRRKLYAFIDPLLPLEIFTDAKKIEQVLQALLQHSINYTDKGDKIFLDVKAIRKNQNDTYDIGFSVRHNGRGLTQEDLEAVARPFSSVNNQALGIGLTLANEFSKLLGTKLEIRSDLAKGSHFSFVLRVKYSGRRDYATLKKNRMRILLLDTTKIDSLNVLAQYFASFGFEVDRATKMDENLYKDVDFVYVIASARETGWIEQLQKIKKRAPLIFAQVLGEQLKKVHHPYFEAILKEPYLPSRIYRHILEVSDYEAPAVSPEEMQLSKNLYALVVEDNVINQKLIEIILKNRGISIAIASDGEEAVEMARREKYDIIFMDIDMPKKNGIAATAEIKKHSKFNANTPVVALTAKALEGDKEELLAKGLDEYMSKPIQKDELEAILKKYFQ